MNLRRKPVQPTRRQRLSQAGSQKIRGFSYNTSSSDQTDRVTRQPLANRSQVKSRKWGKFWLQRAGLLVLIVAILVSVINILRLSPSANIIPLQKAGTPAYLQSLPVYANFANNILKSSAWNRSKATVDTSNLSAQMLNHFPELTNVSVDMPLLSHRPLVYIQAAQPALVIHSDNQLYVVGATGKAFARLAYATVATQSLPQLYDQSGLKVVFRQQVLPTSYVKYVQIVNSELGAKQITVSKYVLPASSSELDAYPAGQPYYVKFNLQDTEPAGEAGTFLAVAAGLKKQSITPSQYVDVRVIGRAYYR